MSPTINDPVLQAALESCLPPSPLSPFSPSSLSPALNGLSLSPSSEAPIVSLQGEFKNNRDFNGSFGAQEASDQYGSVDFSAMNSLLVQGPQQRDLSPSRSTLSLVIPGTDHHNDLGDVFPLDSSDFTQQPGLEMYQTTSPSFVESPGTPLQQHPGRSNSLLSRNPAAHSRNASWTPSTTHGPAMSLTSPTLSFTPPDSYPSPFSSSSSLLEPPSAFNHAEDLFLNTGATVSRRHSHTGGRATSATRSLDERGRSNMRSANTSASSSRRSSPYPSPHPDSGSNGTLAPQQAWNSEQFLAVPTMTMGGGASLPRRHSFSASPYSHQRSVSEGLLSVQHLSPTVHYSQDTIDGSVSQPVTGRMVASTAGIRASQARRTKEARFACDMCAQTFTTNHNLKNHRNVHLGVKEHSCEGCKREFTTQSVLARHTKTCKVLLNMAPA